MKGRWSISTDDGATWVPVDPVNGASIGFADTHDLAAGHAFFRRKLKASVIFEKGDYDMLLPFERNSATRCNPILIKFEEQCSGLWGETWRGKFSAGGGVWDFDTCTVEVKPEVVDRYTCILENAKIKRNILQVAPVDASVIVLPSLEFGICVTVGFVVAPTGGCDEFYGPGGSPLDPPIDEWTAGHSQAGDANGDPYQLNIHWRERIVTECVGGSPVPPIGSGWVLLTDNCAIDGTAVYVRNSSIAWGFGDAVEGTFVDGIPTPPDALCLYKYIGTFDESVLDPFDLTLGPVPFFVCITSASSTAMNRARRLDAVVDYLIEQTGCGLLGMRSDFFEHNAPGDAPGYVAGINYRTDAVNQMNNILILQKTDAIDPGASNPATIGEWTFEEAMMLFRTGPRCLWTIDDAGYVRVEHWTYFAASLGLDIVDMIGVIEPLRYEHLGDRVPRIERPRWMEAQGRDFVGKDLVYSGPCVSGSQEVEEINPGPYTTDIGFVLTDPDAIGKSGFVLLATELAGSVHQCILGLGALSGNLVSNAPLSWANLEDAFWRDDRYLPSGNMNGQDVAFDGWRPNVEQKEVRIPRCCDTASFDPLDSIATKLGQRLLPARRAYVESAEHDPYNEQITLVLRYQY